MKKISIDKIADNETKVLDIISIIFSPINLPEKAAIIEEIKGKKIIEYSILTL